MKGTATGTILGPRVLTWLRVLVSLIVIAVLLSQLSTDRILELVMAGVERWPLMLVALILIGLGHVIQALRWGTLLWALPARVPLRFLVGANLVGMFWNMFLPSTIGGDIMRSWWIQRILGSLAESVTIIAIDRLIGALALCLMVISTAIFLPSIFTQVVGIWWPLAGFGFCLAAIVLLVHPSTHRLTRRLLPLPMFDKIREKIRRIGSVMKRLRAAYQQIIVALLFGVFFHCGIIAQYWALDFALETGVGLYALVILIPLVNLILMVPISIGGFGVREGALSVLGAPFGIGITEAVLLSYCWVLFCFVWGIGGGIIYLFGRPTALAERGVT